MRKLGRIFKSVLVLIAAALFFAATQDANARANGGQKVNVGEVKEGGAGERLTPEEAEEARGLARAFVKRLGETNDITPLVKELFVEDFAERLRHDADGTPMFMVRREVALRASPAELQKFYVAQFNFFALTLEYWWSRPEGPGGEGVVTLEQMYPHEVVAVLRGEPHFAAYINGDESAPEGPGEGGASPDAAESAGVKKGEAGRGDDDDRFVRSLEALRGVTSTAAEAASALRLHVPTFALLLAVQRANVADEDLPEADEPEVETFDEAFYGFPAGTRFVRLEVEPLYDMELRLYAVRVEDGRLRIVTAFPVLGD